MDIQRIITAYFDALSNKSPNELASMVTHDVTFEGPFFQAKGATSFIDGMRRWMELPKSYNIRQQFIHDDTACSIYDVMVTSPAGITVTIPMADVIRLRDGKIAAERLYFDPTEWAKALGKSK